MLLRYIVAQCSNGIVIVPRVDPGFVHRGLNFTKGVQFVNLT